MHKYLDKIKYYFAKKQNTQIFRNKFILKLLFNVNKNCIKKTNMKMNNDDFEAFRKRLKFLCNLLKYLI